MLVLASKSQVRRKLLEEAGLVIEMIPADIDERTLESQVMTPSTPLEELALELAGAKACAVSQKRFGRLVIGADQVLGFQGEVLHKVATLEGARARLERLRGNEHVLYSGVACARDGCILWRHVSVARLFMRPFSDAFLQNYLVLEGETLFSSVGVYRLEGRGAQLFDKIEGNYFSILGLPLVELLAFLRQQGALET